MGIFDAVFPKFDNSVETVQSTFINDDPKIVVNWIRFLSALCTFLVLILNFFKIITIDDIIKILESLPE